MGKPLLDVLRELTLDPDKQAAFADNPSGYLAQYGYEDVEADHLNEAFGLVADTLPPDVAQAVAGQATATAPLDPDDGSGGAPDTTINPDEDAFGGVDESFDTVPLIGVADGTNGLDTDVDAAAGDGNSADGNGGYGTGELALDDLAADGGPFLDSDAEGFTLEEPDDAPDLDGDGGLDLGQAGADGAQVDDVDDEPADDLSFDDIGSF